LQINFKNLKRKYNLEVWGVIHLGSPLVESLYDYQECGVKDLLILEHRRANFNVLFDRLKEFDTNIILRKENNLHLDSYSFKGYNFLIINTNENSFETLKGCAETLKEIDHVICAEFEELEGFLKAHNMRLIETVRSTGSIETSFYTKDNLI